MSRHIKIAEPKREALIDVLLNIDSDYCGSAISLTVL
jgi:hypothetical protein